MRRHFLFYFSMVLYLLLYNISVYSQFKPSNPIADFEGSSHFKEIDFAGPEATMAVPVVISFDTAPIQDTRFPNGMCRSIEWSLNRGQYGFWGLDLSTGRRGFDLTNFESLSFQIIGNTGRERFFIQFEDMDGNKTMRASAHYTNVTNRLQRAVVPLNDIISIIPGPANQGTINPQQIKVIGFEYTSVVSRPSGHIYINNIVLQARDRSRDLILADYAGTLPFTEIIVAGPDSQNPLVTPVNGNVQYIESPSENVHTGRTARMVEWDLRSSQWYGWSVLLGDAQAPFNASMENGISVWVKGNAGGEVFKIEIKDTSGTKAIFTSSEFFRINPSWQNICIPFSHPKILGRIDLAHLESISLVFAGVLHRRGALYFDDLFFYR